MDMLSAFGEAFVGLRTLLVAVAAFALAYVLVRFVFVGLVEWATAGDDESVAARFGPPTAKLLAFGDALAVSAGVAAIDLPVFPTYGLSVVFVLGVGVYRFERLLEGRRAST